MKICTLEYRKYPGVFWWGRALNAPATAKQNMTYKFKWIFGQGFSPNIEIEKLDESARTALVKHECVVIRAESPHLKPADAVNKNTGEVLFALYS